jgi:Cu+-exporting ATPase
MMSAHGIAIPASVAHAAAIPGASSLFVAVGGRLEGVLAYADELRPESASVVKALRGDGRRRIVLLSGDSPATVEAVARTLGIDHAIGGLLPEEKVEAVRRLQSEGHTVAMVGDGINDAPALASAHVGVAIGTGTDIAVAAADIALLRGGIASLPTALRLARSTLRTIRQNLFWAFVYNLVGLPVAAGALYPFTGLLLSPVLASAAMSMSSVSVLMSSLRLRRFAATT